MTKKRLSLLVSLILVAAFSRLLPHPSNVTPVAAIALFAGAYLPRGFSSFAIPVFALLLSDLVIGFHSTMPFVYLGMLITVALGTLLRSKARLLNIVGASLIASVLFFALTNFGVWMMEGIYPQTAAGLVQCYVAAIPFFANSLLGDLLFAWVLFGVFSFAEQRFPQLRASAV
jgi:hypothetical protein